MTVFKLLLISIVVAPVVIAVQAAKGRNARRGLLLALGLVLAYDVLYVVMLYYLRIRWVG